jgi:hypothetical protein
VQEANKEKKSEKKRELFTKATLLYTTADRVSRQLKSLVYSFCAVEIATEKTGYDDLLSSKSRIL